MTRIIGIDPGAHGAIAVLDEAGELLEFHDMPAIEESAACPATNSPLLASLLARTHGQRIYCEFVGAWPTDARSSAFAFGRARGIIEGAAGALRLPIAFLTPPTWKRLAKIPAGAENEDQVRAIAATGWDRHNYSQFLNQVLQTLCLGV